MTVKRAALFTPLCIAFAPPAEADTLQDQIVAAARATPRDGYGFRRMLVSDQTDSPRRTMVERFDPRQPTAQRWTLVSVDGRAPTPKELEQARKAKRGPTTSYADIAQWFGAPATRSEGQPGTVTYRFAGLPRGTIKLGSHDASPDLQVEATVNTSGKTPFVERVRMLSAKKFHMMLVASVDSIVIVSQYRQFADGRAVPAETGSEFTGSMLGKRGKMRAVATYSDFAPGP